MKGVQWRRRGGGVGKAVVLFNREKTTTDATGNGCYLFLAEYDQI